MKNSNDIDPGTWHIFKWGFWIGFSIGVIVVVCLWVIFG